MLVPSIYWFDIRLLGIMLHNNGYLPMLTPSTLSIFAPESSVVLEASAKPSLGGLTDSPGLVWQKFKNHFQLGLFELVLIGGGRF